MLSFNQRGVFNIVLLTFNYCLLVFLNVELAINVLRQIAFSLYGFKITGQFMVDFVRVHC